ncbi:MAG: helix-turn-helix transcriptional regulator [Clostridia bacterium]|nr:helix-turn-helix transcriptional regulator [Clostridia bacterium]
MFINKTSDGLNNVCGKNIASFRTELKISQRELADRMQLVGIDLDKNAIQRIECGKRFVTDIEIIAFAKIFDVTFEELLKTENKNVFTSGR